MDKTGKIHTCMNYPEDKAPKDFTVSPCPYCGKLPVPLSGEEVYPHRPDLHSKPFWVCWTCKAWVGCHPGTQHPLGTLANGPLRKLRGRVHAAFDHLRKKGKMKRGDAYRLLRQAMGLSKNDCHVSKFDDKQCLEALEKIKTFS